jgi:hypothetical protein
MSLEYRELVKRIRAARDSDTLYRLEKSCFNIYNAGLLTPREFGRLDVLIMEKLALI